MARGFLSSRLCCQKGCSVLTLPIQSLQTFGKMFVLDKHIDISFQTTLTRRGVVRPLLTRQLVSGKGGVGESAPDSLKYILILECGEGVFGSSLDRYWGTRQAEREVLGGCV